MPSSCPCVLILGARSAAHEKDRSLRMGREMTTVRRPDIIRDIGQMRGHHDEIGYNYRMPNINAALGVAQLAQLEPRLAQKRALAERYLLAFADVDGVSGFAEREGTRSNYWLNTILLEPETADARDTVLRVLNDGGFMARPVWEPLHSLDMYSECPSAPLPVTNSLADRIINVPSSAKLAGKVP